MRRAWHTGHLFKEAAAQVATRGQSGGHGASEPVRNVEQHGPMSCRIIRMNIYIRIYWIILGYIWSIPMGYIWSHYIMLYLCTYVCTYIIWNTHEYTYYKNTCVFLVDVRVQYFKTCENDRTPETRGTENQHKQFNDSLRAISASILTHRENILSQLVYIWCVLEILGAVISQNIVCV